MPWHSLLQGVLGMTGVLAALAGAMIMMTKLTKGSGKNMILVATSMVIMAAAIDLLTPALIALSLVPLILLVKSLGALAAAFAVFALGAKLLAPVAITLLTIAVAVALLGAGILALGVAVIEFGSNLGVAAGILLLLIPGLIKALEVGLIALCDLVIESAPKIASAVNALVFAVFDILLESVPKIVDVLLEIVLRVIVSLADRIYPIVEALMDIIIGVIQAIIDKLPELLSAFKMDPVSIEALFSSVLMLGTVMAVAAGFKLLGKAALIGVLYMGLVIAELSLVLATVGLLNKIPGLQDFVESGGDLLQAIGVALGQFVGGLLGGIALGMLAPLPLIGKCLSKFMTNAETFIKGVKEINGSVLSSTRTLIDVILTLTTASLVNGLIRGKQIFTGAALLSSFGDELVAFAPKIKQYADIVAGIDASAVEASANAAKCLAELAHNLPNSGGLLGEWLGENDIDTFGEMLVPFGNGLVAYSKAVTNIDAEAIANSVTAAKGLVQLAEAIPNTGGFISVFTGDNRMDVFGTQLAWFGRGIKDFATEVSGLVDDGSITAAVTAAKSLVELSNNIPNEGGVVAWFAGENSIVKFAGSLKPLGQGIKEFANEVTGLNAASIEAAAGAAKALAEMTDTIPNEGGVAAWFAGENSVVTFADSLPLLGQGLQGFATATAGITPETVIAAANAAKVLAEMTDTIPNEGGIAAWFSGESSISKFGNDLTSLGQGIKGFAVATVGITPETVNAAATACKTLAEMTAVIPTEGGIKAWFAGESSVSKFGNDLTALGQGIKGFAEATVGINAESVTAAATAAKDIAAIVEVIPSEGGIKAWFAGETSISKFSGELPKLGEGLAGFSTAVANINTEKVSASASAAKAIAEMTNTIPKEGGIKAWFTGESSISNFADKLPALGEGLSGFSKSVAGINPENVTAASNAAKALAEMADTAPKDSSKIASFGDNIKTFGSKLKEYFNEMKEVSGDTVTAASEALDEIKEVSNINSGNITSLATAIKELTKAIKQMATDIKDDLKTAGKEAIESFISGIDEQLTPAETACTDVLSACVTAISEGVASFYNAGANLVTGFANGISETTYLAEARSRAMAAAAAEAAKKELDEHSPSKVGRKIGDYFGVGFVDGIANNIDKAYGTSTEMANSAKEGLRNTVSKIGDLITSDIDSQPTIRPVIDLTDVKSGADAINNMFGANSLGLTANVGAISSMMNKKNQNGANDDVVYAIDELAKRIDKIEKPSYNINGVNFDNDSAVVEAFETIIGAARRARRT